jgi:hypothetical protein
MVRYKGFAKDFDKTPKAWQYFAIIASFVIMIVMVGLMLSTVFGQITDSEFINCIIMETKGTQVVLGTDSDCSTELFTQAVTYYKSIGYNETSYGFLKCFCIMFLNSSKNKHHTFLSSISLLTWI